MENFNVEIWKPGIYIYRNGNVVDLSECYMVSNFGRVRSIAREIPQCAQNKSGKFYKKERIRKIKKSAKLNYVQVTLSLNNTIKHYYVHRLVASTFPEICGKYFNGAEVNHKDENPENNCAWNLEWVSHSDNIKYGNWSYKQRTSHINRQDISKPVLQFTKNGEFIKEYQSISEVSRIFGYCVPSISACCKHKPKHNTAYGFKWEYKQ